MPQWILKVIIFNRVIFCRTTVFSSAGPLFKKRLVSLLLEEIIYFFELLLFVCNNNIFITYIPHYFTLLHFRL